MIITIISSIIIVVCSIGIVYELIKKLTPKKKAKVYKIDYAKETERIRKEIEEKPLPAFVDIAIVPIGNIVKDWEDRMDEVRQGNSYRNSHLLANAYGKQNNNDNYYVGQNITIYSNYVAFIQIASVLPDNYECKLIAQPHLTRKEIVIIEKLTVNINREVNIKDIPYMKNELDNYVIQAIYNTSNKSK